jgi:protein-disulfide isomerase
VAQSKRKGHPRKGASGGGQGAFHLVLGLIALAGVAAIVYAVRGAGTGGAATEPVALDIADSRELMERATPKRIGSETAPTRVVVFSDFQCPGCAAFALRERPKIMPFVERGDVQIIAYDYPLGGAFVHSFLVARAARCAGEQPMTGTPDGTAYWPYHDLLYYEQSSWSPQRAVTDNLTAYAQQLNLDARAFEQCLRSDRYADVVTANRMIGDQLGVQGTPTVLVNNRRIGGRTIDEMGNEVVRILRETTGDGAAASQ